MPETVDYKFGLIGKTLSYSFSKGYHNERFAREFPQAWYDLYELDSAAEICELLRREPKLVGLNVTIPYKTSVIPFLDELDEVAERAGAVNTIVRSAEGLMGFNTDVWGFVKSLKEHLPPQVGKALVFGTGGSSKAVTIGLMGLGIEYLLVSRRPISADAISYSQVTESVIAEHTLLINCTPVGMTPNDEHCLDIPYHAIGAGHIVFDLIYNPGKTVFLERSERNGATVVNGLKMLHYQADHAWDIWRRYLDIRI